MEEYVRIREQIAAITTYDEFEEAASQLGQLEAGSLFETLWSLSLNSSAEPWSEMASLLLIKIQPLPNRSLDQLLEDIHTSSLDASNRTVSFFLITQFGQSSLRTRVSDFLRTLPESSVRSRVDVIHYWSSFPAVMLCEPLQSWEFRDMYGIADDA